jgi:alanyl-tRNA synthetase
MPEERIYAFERTPYRRQLTTHVLAAGDAAGRPFVELADTLLYPEGGGQPADRGTVGGVEVVELERRDEAIRHWLAAPVGVGPVVVELDWSRRFDHMQQHTAQHLLTAIAADRFGWPTTSFHLGVELCDVELDVQGDGARPFDDASLAELEDMVAEEIRRDLYVSTLRWPPERVDLSAVRSRGLPAGHRGSVRLVEIHSIDVATCGGTHVRSTCEIEALKLLSHDSLRGGRRLHWVAGGRVRRRLGRHEARNAALRQVLGAADDELVTIAQGKLEQLQQLSRRWKAATARWAELEAASLARRAGDDANRCCDAHYDDLDAASLGSLARQAVAQLPDALVLLTSKLEGDVFFVLVGGVDKVAAVAATGPDVATALGGRGGGRGGVFQGKAPSLDGRDDAVAALRRRVADPT